MAWYPSGVLFGGSFLKTWAKKRNWQEQGQTKKKRNKEREKKREETTHHQDNGDGNDLDAGKVSELQVSGW